MPESQKIIRSEKQHQDSSEGSSVARLESGSTGWCRSRLLGLWLLLLTVAVLGGQILQAADSPVVKADHHVVGMPDPKARLEVREYVVKYNTQIFTNVPAVNLSSFTGTNLGLDRVALAAATVLAEFQKQGHATAYISIAQEFITNGLVTMHVYKGASPQILISGTPCLKPGEAGISADFLALVTPPSTNVPGSTSTNPVPRFPVEGYEITGNTLLTTNRLNEILLPGVGTNVALTEIIGAASAMQKEYRDRGYPTVSVTIPPQQITNGIVKIRVFEGVLSDIVVAKNHYFSSNNVMRSLPSLHTNTILSSPVFQAELDRANANQDRQIYPVLEPGPEPNTTLLRLDVKDRLPLHAKVELNNQSTPGTPELRVNNSASYNNLWQQDHSLGVQYSFSPEAYKGFDGVPFYDRPRVVNYGGFYRLPLGDYGAVEEQVNNGQGNFGYNEATHTFRLPTATGRPELNFFASRSYIDTSILTLSTATLYSTNGNKLVQRNVQQDLTENNGLGGRLSLPLPSSGNFQSGFSGGFDFKSYQLSSAKTNIFTLTSLIIDNTTGSTVAKTNINVSEIDSPVPTTGRLLNYLPLSVRYDASMRDARGVTAFGLGLNGNAWHTGARADLESISGSTKSSGNWVVLQPNLVRTFTLFTNWDLTLRADGQWASEPLISNEQYALGGLGTVRGYQEGAVFGDTGWHVSVEQKTPPCVLGVAYPKHPLVVRGMVYLDYGQAYLLDPQGRRECTPLWGVGFGGVGTIGANWEARLFFSVPLLDAGAARADQPRFDFSLSAQF